MSLRNAFGASKNGSVGDSQHIKTMLKSEENEVLALYGGGRNMLSQKYKNWYASVWPSWFSRNVRGIHKEFMGCSTNSRTKVHKACECWAEVCLSTENATTK